jgi:hypothetical protein
VRDGVRSLSAGAASLWARRPGAARAAALLFVAGLSALGVGGVAYQSSLPGHLPSPLDWSAARALLERDARQGDAVAVSPAWAERARMVLPAQAPVLDGPGLATGELTGVRRVWLVALPGAPGFSWETELGLVERGARSDPLRLGGLEVTRFELAYPDLPLAFLPDWLARAAATVGGEPCTPDGSGALRCPGPGAPTITRSVREVGGRPRPCLVATGVAAGPVALTFPAVPMGRVLRGHAGIAGDPGGAGSQIRIGVQVDGEEVGAAELAGAGWSPFQIDTSRFAERVRPLTLTVNAAGIAGPVCLDAVTLP